MEAQLGSLPLMGREVPVVTLMWVGVLGSRQGPRGPRQLEVSAHDLLSLDAGISLGFPGLFSSDTQVLCNSGPVLPSFWTSVSLFVKEGGCTRCSKGLLSSDTYPPPILPLSIQGHWWNEIKHAKKEKKGMQK